MVKASTANGGHSHDVPILKDSQRKLLDEARRLAMGGAVIPCHRNYAEQKKVCEDQTRKAGLGRKVNRTPRARLVGGPAEGDGLQGRDLTPLGAIQTAVAVATAASFDTWVTNSHTRRAWGAVSVEISV